MATLVAIIPINMYTDQIAIQHCLISLTIWVPPFVIILIVCHALDVYDLKQRGQFTVLYFMQCAIFGYFRFYDTPYYFYQCVKDNYAAWDKYSQIGIASGIIFHTVFNVCWFKVLVVRFYHFLFTDKYLKDPKKSK
eukprot:UN08427